MIDFSNEFQCHMHFKTEIVDGHKVKADCIGRNYSGTCTQYSRPIRLIYLHTYLISTQVISSGKSTYFLRRDTLKRNSGIYRHISRICVNEDYKSHFDRSHLAIVELESPFTDMNPFYSPLWSQPNKIFYPQDAHTGLFSYLLVIYRGVNGRWAEWDIAHSDF